MGDAYYIEDEVHQRAYDAGLMRRLLGYVRPHWRLMAASTVLLLLATLMSTLKPFLDMAAIDRYINNPDAADRVAGLNRLILIIGVLLLGEMLIRGVQVFTVAYVGQKTMLEMRVQLFEHLQKMSLRFLDRNPVGRLMTRVTNDVERIQETVVSGTVQVISDLFTIFVILAFMLWVNWRLALVTLSTVPFVFVTSLVFRRYARRTFLEIRKKIAALNAYMQENIAGMRIVQLFLREDKNFEEYRRRNREYRNAWFKQIRYHATYFCLVDFLGALSVALIILYGGYENLEAGGAASMGLFFAYVQWAERLFAPIRGLADRYNLLLEAMASSERIFQLLDTPEEIQNKPDAIQCGRLEGGVSFQDAWFAYEPGQWVLKGVDLDIAPGERVAIVGHTGAGKTTIINLLSRFYDVQRGVIAVDGVDVRDYDKTALRKNIGIVLQDVFLFAGSIRDNIRLGDGDLAEERVRSCAEYVNAARFINRLPAGYEYDVGERGGNISMGQRQLLAFARALAHDPQILVLDEATSSVDTETEALIQDAIGKLMEGRTSIVIAHRLSTIQNADRIVMLHHGEIREMGTHQELLARRGLYYRLYQLQYKNRTERA